VKETDPGPAPTAEVVREPLELGHHHPGRLRVRAELFRLGEGDPRVRDAAAAMRGMPGVTRFEHNARTGSVLVEYEPGLARPDELLARLAEAAGVAPCANEALARARTPALIAVGALQEVNAIAAELTGQTADLRSLVPAGLAALSAYAWVTSKEHRLPRWDNLLWWSYSVFMNHHWAEIEVSAEERRLARAARSDKRGTAPATAPATAPPTPPRTPASTPA
jgi:hypothetical protein